MFRNAAQPVVASQIQPFPEHRHKAAQIRNLTENTQFDRDWRGYFGAEGDFLPHHN